jgi:GAF domain-containing protein
MMISGDEIGTHVFTHPDAPDIDRAQYTAGDGPCLHAFRTGEVVQVPTMGAETRWPLFVEAALQHGILSTLSLPVFGTDGPVGAMNLYSEVEHAFGREEIATAQLLVEQAGYVLVNTDAFLEERQTSAGLRLAIESRSVIDQAKGIIMGAQHVSADEAFALLVKQSQFENVKLRTVADSLVRSTSRSG